MTVRKAHIHGLVTSGVRLWSPQGARGRSASSGRGRAPHPAFLMGRRGPPFKWGAQRCSAPWAGGGWRARGRTPAGRTSTRTLAGLGSESGPPHAPWPAGGGVWVRRAGPRTPRQCGARRPGTARRAGARAAFLPAGSASRRRGSGERADWRPGPPAAPPHARPAAAPGPDPPLSAGGVGARGWVAGSSRRLCAPASGLALRGRGGGGRGALGAQAGGPAELRGAARRLCSAARPRAAPAPGSPLCPRAGAAAAAAASERRSELAEAVEAAAPPRPCASALAPRRCRTRSPCRNSWPRPMRTTRRPRPPASPPARRSAGTPWRPSRR